MKFDRLTTLILVAYTQQTDEKNQESLTIESPAIADVTEVKESQDREVLPIREYVAQQLLHALQGRGLDDFVLGVEQTLAGAVANTQNLLWKNDIVEGLARQREMIRRNIDEVDPDEVPSLLAAIPKRAPHSWTGRLVDADGNRLPSFADVLTDNWTQTIKETVNLPIMGPLNPAVWRPEDVAEVLGPILNMIPHETAKLVRHREQQQAEEHGFDWDSLLAAATDINGLAAASKLPKYQAEVPGVGHIVMDDEWHPHRVNPTLLDIPLLGPLNPVQQLSANLPPVYLPYKALRLRDHPPEWMNLDGINAMMPVNAYTPKYEGGRDSKRSVPLHSILRGRRLGEAAAAPSWAEQLTQSKFVRSILHYLPRYKNKEATPEPDLQSLRSLAKQDIVEEAPAALVAAVKDEDEEEMGFASSLDGKRYYRAPAEAPAGEVRGADI